MIQIISRDKKFFVRGSSWDDQKNQYVLIPTSKPESKKDMNPKYKEMLLTTAVFVGAFAVTYILVLLLF